MLLMQSSVSHSMSNVQASPNALDESVHSLVGTLVMKPTGPAGKVQALPTQPSRNNTLHVIVLSHFSENPHAGNRSTLGKDSVTENDGSEQVKDVESSFCGHDRETVPAKMVTEPPSFDVTVVPMVLVSKFLLHTGLVLDRKRLSCKSSRASLSV
jgi:hypothetical protein